MFEPGDTSYHADGTEEDEMLILDYAESSEDDFLTTNYSQETWGDF